MNPGVCSRTPSSRAFISLASHRPFGGREGKPMPGTTPRLRILVVEDHVDTARALANLLTTDGHAVRCAFDGNEAMRVLADGAFDLLICDLCLPQVDGYRVMSEARARCGIPGIAISGLGGADDVERARAAGFAHYLVKPVEWKALKVLVAELAPRDVN